MIDVEHKKNHPDRKALAVPNVVEHVGSDSTFEDLRKPSTADSWAGPEIAVLKNV